MRYPDIDTNGTFPDPTDDLYLSPTLVSTPPRGKVTQVIFLCVSGLLLRLTFDFREILVFTVWSLGCWGRGVRVRRSDEALYLSPTLVSTPPRGKVTQVFYFRFILRV